MDPLILTLHLDDDSFARLDALRRTHFPAERNMIPAHVTLFHALPGDRIDAVQNDILRVTAEVPPLPFEATEVMSLGRGAAIRLDVPGLADLRKRLARRWEDDLTAQDRQTPKPHVTVQNKVTKERAERTLAQLRATFAPWSGLATGLDLWHYRGGPWEAAGTFPFRGTG